MLQGVIPPLTTPFSEDGEILYKELEKNLDFYAGSRLAGVLALGSNGEAVHLTPSERSEIVRVARSGVPRDRIFLVGVSEASLDQARGFIDSVADVPATAYLVSVPSYYRNRMSSRAIRLFYERLAETAPAPLLLYNVPQYSGIELAPDLVRELARHERIIGMKDSSGNLIYLQRVLRAIQDRPFEIILGSAQLLAPGMALGLRAAILAVACALPELPIRVLLEEGSPARQSQRLDDLFGIAEAVTVRFGIPGLKYAMDLAGLHGGACRLPLLPLEETQKKEVRDLVDGVVEAEGATAAAGLR